MASTTGRGGFAYRVGLFLLPRLGAAYLRTVRATMRLERIDADRALPSDGGPVIYAFWHAQLAMMPWVQFRPPTVVPVSQSRDGELTSRLFARLGVEPVRGSSSRGGAIAARAVIAAIRRGRDVGITLDGPRGPARVIQPGATWLAKATSRPLLPVAFDCSRKRRLSTWDRMLLPLPFGRGVFVYGEHLWLPREVTDQELVAADIELTGRVEALGVRAADALLK